MKNLTIALLVASAAVAGCAGGSSGTYTGGGDVKSACLDTCIDQTKNRALCEQYLDKGRESCGKLVKAVCDAAPSSCGNTPGAAKAPAAPAK